MSERGGGASTHHLRRIPLSPILELTDCHCALNRLHDSAYDKTLLLTRLAEDTTKSIGGVNDAA